MEGQSDPACLRAYLSALNISRLNSCVDGLIDYPDNGPSSRQASSVMLAAKICKVRSFVSNTDGLGADVCPTYWCDGVPIVFLAYHSANVLFLASTVMVPIGNVAFSLKIVPHHQDLKPSDTMGLVFILIGNRCYR